MNEGHSLSLNFHLYSKFKSLEEVKRRVVFTTHTPEAAGNESHSYAMLQDMSFFCGLQNHEVQSLLGLGGDHLNYTLAALKFARKANAVSELHGVVSRDMWKSNPGICEITSITNSQNKTYWKDDILESALESQDDDLLSSRKKELKRQLFKVVADQTGKLFSEDVLTIVWARRFAGYKRADMIMNDWSRFLRLIDNTTMPLQIIWAGKPYPEDYGAIDLFNSIIDRVKPFANCAVLTGYELGLSALLKKGSDVWLNNPRMYREASGTSGMTAAINASINLSIPDGWIPEFAKDMENSFIIAPAEDHLSFEEKDRIESERLLEKIENDIVPMYYNEPAAWTRIMKNSAYDVSPAFEAGRMASQYYELMYRG
jgi:starch phosphorylase